MQEYLDLGHMNESYINSNAMSYFKPHHGVMRDSVLAGQLRVVFNASCQTTSGLALNDLQMIGPTIQNDLITILLRLREYAYVVCADVSKIYRQILIAPEQCPL